MNEIGRARCVLAGTGPARTHTQGGGSLPTPRADVGYFPASPVSGCGVGYFRTGAGQRTIGETESITPVAWVRSFQRHESGGGEYEADVILGVAEKETHRWARIAWGGGASDREQQPDGVVSQRKSVEKRSHTGGWSDNNRNKSGRSSYGAKHEAAPMENARVSKGSARMGDGGGPAPGAGPFGTNPPLRVAESKPACGLARRHTYARTHTCLRTHTQTHKYIRLRTDAPTNAPRRAHPLHLFCRPIEINGSAGWLATN